MKIGGVNLSGMPLLPVMVAFVAGELSALGFPAAMQYAAMGCVALCVVFILLRRYFAAVMSAFGCVGIMAVWISSPAPNQCIGKCGVFEGCVTEVAVRPLSQRFVFDAYQCGDSSGSRIYAGKTVVYLGSSLPVVERGDYVAVKGLMHDAYGPVEDGGWRVDRFAGRRGITGLMKVWNDDVVVVVEVSGWYAVVDRIRQDFSDAVYYSGVSSPTAAMLDALLLGNVQDIDDDMRDSFAKAGLSHVLALSGAHVAVIALMVSMLFFPLRMAGRRKWGMGCAIVCLWLYAFLTGGAPSVVRAVIMASVVLWAGMSERNYNSANSLCGAALLILLFDPMAIIAPGFQLSFLAVAGILMFAPFLSFGRGILRVATQWIGVSFGAVVMTAPLAAWHFHVMPFYFLLANMVVALVLPWFMGGAVLLLILNLTPFPTGWLCRVLDAMCCLVSDTSAMVAGLPGAYVDGLDFSAWALPAWYAAVLVGLMALRTRRIAYVVACGMLAVFAMGVSMLL